MPTKGSLQAAPPYRPLSHAIGRPEEDQPLLQRVPEEATGSGADDGMEGYSGLALDAGAWGMNVITAVIIIMVNKLLMGRAGYCFNFAATLSGMHFMASYGAMEVQRRLGYLKLGGEVPLKDLAFFVVMNDISIVSLNISLMVNTVGFYQIAKLLNIPFVCCVEWLWLKRQFPLPVIASIVVVAIGVAMVTISDVSVGIFGLNVALISVVAAGMQQILCSQLQKKYKTSSSELLLVSGFPVGLSLLMLGPFIDRLKSGQWVSQFNYTAAAVGLICLSTTVAIFVNISAFLCLGRFSAVAYQIMGHTKTFLILMGGVVFFGEHINMKQGIGMVIAITGMIGYGYFSSRAASNTPPAADDTEKLLEDEEKGESDDSDKEVGNIKTKPKLMRRVNSMNDSTQTNGVIHSHGSS